MRMRIGHTQSVLQVSGLTGGALVNEGRNRCNSRVYPPELCPSEIFQKPQQQRDALRVHAITVRMCDSATPLRARVCVLARVRDR